ncbi:MAG: hypothetical protein RLZ59_1534, partial [Pseudomonadota bacterium]
MTQMITPPSPTKPLLATLKGKRGDRLPMWLMRQA